MSTNAKYGIPLSRYTVFLQNCPLGYDPKCEDFLLPSCYIVEIIVLEFPFIVICLERHGECYGVIEHMGDIEDEVVDKRTEEDYEN